jgi:Family of unknown function (DUF6454)
MIGKMILALALALAGAAGVDGVQGARLVETLPLAGELFHVQGVDMDRDHIWVTSVDTRGRKGYLHQFSRTGVFERRVEITDGVRYHPGGFSIQGDTIWVPVAEYTPHSTAVIEEIDKRTLAIRRKILVADHLGCLAASDQVLVAGNWDSKILYVFNLQGEQLRTVPNPTSNSYQDMKFAGGRLVASGSLTRTTGAVDWYAWPSMAPLQSRPAGLTDHGVRYTEEGMALEGRELYLLPEDGPSRLFHFRLDP